MRKGTTAESTSATVSIGWRYEKELAKKTGKKQPVIWQENQESVLSGNQKKKVFQGKGMIHYIKYLLINQVK